MEKYQWLNVDSILLWDENPRGKDIHTGEKLSQVQIIKSFFKTKKKRDEMFNLANDIVSDGLMETELLCIYNDGEDLISIDGNRRLVTFKLILNPSLVNDNQILYDFYNSFKKSEIGNTVYSFVTQDLSRALKIAEKKHLGPSEGRGLVSWDPKEKTFFYVQHTNNPKKTPSYTLRTEHPALFETLVNQLSATSVDRVLSFSNFKKHVAVENYDSLSENKAKEVKKNFLKIKKHADDINVKLSRLTKSVVEDVLSVKTSKRDSFDLELFSNNIEIVEGETKQLQNYILNVESFESIAFVTQDNVNINDGLFENNNTQGQYNVQIKGIRNKKEYSKFIYISVVKPSKKPISLKTPKFKLFSTQFNHKITFSHTIDKFIDQANLLDLNKKNLIANACLRVALEECLRVFCSNFKHDFNKELRKNIDCFKKELTDNKALVTKISKQMSYSYNSIESFIDTIESDFLAKKLNYLTHNIQNISQTELESISETVSKMIVILGVAIDLN